MPLFPPLRKARLTPLIPPAALAVLISLRKRLLTQQILTSLPFSLGTELRFTPSISDAVFIKPHGSFLFFSCACFPATDINFKRIPFVPQRTPSRTGGNARRLLLSHLRPDVHARSAPTPPRPSLRLRRHLCLRLHPHLDLHGAYGSLAASCRHGPEASEQGPRPPAHQRNPQRPAGGGRSDCHSLLGPRQAAVLLINPLKVKNMVG